MAATGSRRGTLIAGTAGVLWVVLALVRVPLTGVLDQPSWTDDPSVIVDFYTNSSFDTAFMVGIASATVAYVLFLVFIAKAADLLGDSDGGSRWVGYLIVGGAAMDTALVYAYLAPFVAAVFWAGHGGLSADAYLTLHSLSFSFLWMEMITITVWAIPLGVAIIRTELFPKWLGWLLLANAVGMVVAFFLPYAVWAVLGGLPYLWILIAAITMLRRPDRFSGIPEPVA
jgi:hypothetical protein